MDCEWFEYKEQAILLAKELVDEAAQTVEEYLPEVSEELGWFRDELMRELARSRGDRMSRMESDLYGNEATA